ncbi:MAG: dolichyl-phosphate beta-glucosyltransferase [Peltula sp. TS41687]|nr:MAG: dolichyl-phosphate beta-glucosyltransferase [Peltula sp. TS41687]
MWSLIPSTTAVTISRLIQSTPPPLLLLALLTVTLGIASLFYLALFIVAPVPRLPRASEKRFTTVTLTGQPSTPQRLSCWVDAWNANREAAGARWDPAAQAKAIDDAEVFLSVVVPAYNEEERLTGMLEEAVEYLQQQEYRAEMQESQKAYATTNGNKRMNGSAAHGSYQRTPPSGWEILIVSDGSTDRTVDVALRFARAHRLGVEGFDKQRLDVGTTSRTLRVVTLESNRGKGGAVTHGMRHVCGAYVLFADADGASTFSDVGKLMSACEAIQDPQGRAVAIGSRAHLVGSEAVVKLTTTTTTPQRSFLRNLLMHSFHLFLRLLTPPATAAIKDTQCGFKLFSRPSLPHIIPFMHSEGWIFDVEMLMLAEAAGIPVAEVAVGWKEVKGSKLNVIWDSLGMAWGLAVLRAAWAFGVYRRY